MRKLLPQLILCLFASVTTVSALQYDDFTYEINSSATNTVAIKGYTGDGGTVTILATIDTKPVTQKGGQPNALPHPPRFSLTKPLILRFIG